MYAVIEDSDVEKVIPSIDLSEFSEKEPKVKALASSFGNGELFSKVWGESVALSTR